MAAADYHHSFLQQSEEQVAVVVFFYCFHFGKSEVHVGVVDVERVQCLVGCELPYSVAVGADEQSSVACFVYYRYRHVVLSAFECAQHSCLVVVDE